MTDIVERLRAHLDRATQDYDGRDHDTKEAADEIERLVKALEEYETEYCEGWCKEAPGFFADCGGCKARAALNQGEK